LIGGCCSGGEAFPVLTGSTDLVGDGEFWCAVVGGFGASRAFLGRSADDRLGFFSIPVAAEAPPSFRLPTEIRFAFGGVGGTKLGGLSLRPDIRPSDINFRRLENSSGSPFADSGGYNKSLTSSMAVEDFDFDRGFDDEDFSVRFSDPAGPISIL